jgi:hypothetical protein
LSSLHIAWLACTSTASAVVLYWLYTLAGLHFLRPLLGWPRRLLLAAGLILPVLTLLKTPSPDGFIPLLLSLGLLTYALRRQWVFPASASILVSTETTLIEPEECLVWTDSGRAVPLRLLAKERIVVLEDLLLVHCRLSRSLACFKLPEVTPRLSLPHASGFSIQSAQHHWDGVDGSAIGHGKDLTRCSFGVGTKTAWLQRHPQGELFLTPHFSSAPEHSPHLPPLGSVGGLPDPMRWGLVRSKVWVPFNEGESQDLSQTPLQDDEAPPFLLSRWAAHVRGLHLPEGSS